ncbi:FAD synthase [Patescibacteria group bacterium]|nr:FAD synthase [Patescibacteria group bacterium]
MNEPHPSPLLKKERGSGRTVMAFGTFDIFHPGHENYLKQARKLGDKLIVIVARDENVEKIKRQKSRNNEQDRLRVVKKCELADEVVLGNLENKYGVIEKYRPNILAIGYDQQFNRKEVEGKLKSINLKAEVVRLAPYKPEIYKSSKLKL